MVKKHTDQKESSLGEPCFPITSFGFVLSINALTTTTFNDSQPMIQLANRAHRINDQSEITFIKEVYSVFLPSSV